MYTASEGTVAMKTDVENENLATLMLLKSTLSKPLNSR